MPSFVYVARETATGREIRNSVEATTEQAAITALLNRNLLVVSIQEKVGKKGKTSGGKVALQDLVMFTRQLATMMASAPSWCGNDNKVKEEHAEYFAPPQSPRSDAHDAPTL